MTIQEIEQKSLELNAPDKIHLVEKLLSSLESPDPEVEQAWIREADERFAAYESGRLGVVSMGSALKSIVRR